MTDKSIIHIHLEKQPEGVWLATSPELPGMFVEGEEPDELMNDARNVAADMLRLTGKDPGDGSYSFDFSVGDA